MSLINVKVDKRCELMGVLLLISNYNKEDADLIEECNNKEYRDKIFSWFNKFKNEKCVKLLNEIIDKLCFNYDAPIYLIEQLNEDYTYEKLLDYPFKERLQSSKLVIDFLNEIPNFVKKTNFEEFFESNKNFYQTGINQIKNLIKDYNIVGFLKDFYKTDFKDVNFFINLMHFATHGNYGVNINNNYICNACLRKSEDGKINFIDEKFNTLSLYVHEFSHSIINPLTDKYSDIKLDFFNDIYDKMKRLVYSSAEVIIDEHIIRGIEIVFSKGLKGGQDFAEEYIKDNIDSGFIYIETVVKSLENYLKNIDIYKNFEEYFPTILIDIKKHKQMKENTF